MADKSFGVKELNLLNASGTPTVTSPNNLNLNANTVAISTSCTIGNNLTVTSTTNSANLNVTGIGTLTRGFATDLSVSGISTISQPSNANPHSLWDVVNNGSSAYRFTGPGQSGDENNPNIYLVRGQRYIFKVNASGHPFQLRVANGGAAYSDGVTNNGAQSGNVVINVQHDAPAQLYYQCTNHGSMVGNIYIVGGPQVISGVVTATTFSGSGASLTNLPAANLTGTLPAISGANLTSLPSQVSISNNANDRIFTGGGGTNLVGESGLTFNGNNLAINASSDDGRLSITGYEGYDARLSLIADEGDDHIDQWNIRSKASNNTLTIDQFGGGTFNTRLTIASDANNGDVTVNTGDLIIGTAGKGVDFPNSSLFESSVNMYLDIASGNNDFYVRSGGNVFAAFKGSAKDLQLTSGNLVIGTSGKGIDFSATSNASETGASMSNELLDDYEEGSWTVSLKIANYNFNGAYTSQSGKYTKVGNKVTVSCYLQLSSKGNDSGALKIEGLPFTSASGNGSRGSGSVGYYQGMSGMDHPMLILIEQSDTRISLRQSQSTGSGNVDDSNISNSFGMFFSLTYFT